MKKILSVIFVCLCLQLQVSALEAVSLGNMPKEQVEISKKPKIVKGSLLISDDEMLDELIKLQKQKDLEDIDMLWKGTVDNNKVIGFALKKLSTPESERRIHSSLMAKTLSAVISGSSLVPTVMGTDPTVRTGAFAVGRLAQALINKKTIPQEVPLTDTELIELAGLVEDLQDQIIGAYYNYKSSLNQVKDTRARLILYNKNYNNALKSNDILDISVSSSLYDNMVLEEYNYTQLATKYHLELQRLAGKKTVDKLNLYQYNINSAMFKSTAKPKPKKAHKILPQKTENVVVPKIETKKSNFVQKIIPKKKYNKTIENKQTVEPKQAENIAQVKSYQQISKNETYQKPQQKVQSKLLVQDMQAKKVVTTKTKNTSTPAKTVTKAQNIKTITAKTQVKPQTKAKPDVNLPKMPVVKAKKKVTAVKTSQNTHVTSQYAKSKNKIEILNIMMPNIPPKTSVKAPSLTGKPKIVAQSHPLPKSIAKKDIKVQTPANKKAISSNKVSTVKPVKTQPLTKNESKKVVQQVKKGGK